MFQTQHQYSVYDGEGVCGGNGQWVYRWNGGHGLTAASGQHEAHVHVRNGRPQEEVHLSADQVPSGTLACLSFLVVLTPLMFLVTDKGARCSSVVRAFTYGAMGRWIDSSWGGSIELFLVPASGLRLV